MDPVLQKRYALTFNGGVSRSPPGVCGSLDSVWQHHQILLNICTSQVG